MAITCQTLKVDIWNITAAIRPVYIDLTVAGTRAVWDITFSEDGQCPLVVREGSPAVEV